MGNRRLAQIATSDEEDEVPPPPRRPPPSKSSDKTKPSKRKRMKLQVEDEEEEEQQQNTEEQQNAEEESVLEDAKPVGDVIRVSGTGKWKRKHYSAFEFDGIQYQLEDPVLLAPEDETQKPYVAIIKDITQKRDGSVHVSGQWFYRPEEAEKRGGGNWQVRDTRELFYSFHRDEVPAESVLHKCVVHFIPLNKKFPHRKEHPGFIVQKVYDTVERKLWKLTDKDYEDNKQHEIDLLVQKTLSRLGELHDIETEDSAGDQDDQLKNKKTLRRKNLPPIDVSRDEDATGKHEPFNKAETPASCPTNAYNTILANFNALSRETQRDKWLEKLLEAVQFICNCGNDVQVDAQGRDGEVSGNKHSETANESQEKSSKDDESFPWPDAAVPAVASLEKVAHEALGADFLKYNQKMRQLSFNLKNNALLARRLLNGELEPSRILNMTPTELK
ncbi:Bromo adjacent homology (BAH) domain, partial [Dillenia turbinata]